MKQILRPIYDSDSFLPCIISPTCIKDLFPAILGIPKWDGTENLWKKANISEHLFPHLHAPLVATLNRGYPP